jgi:hypothetical protein
MPLRPTAPPQAPEAVHDVALVEPHERTAAWPEATDAGDADIVALEAGMSVTVAETGLLVPPAPVHASE